MNYEQRPSIENLGEWPDTNYGISGDSVAFPRSSRPVHREILEDDQKRRKEFLLRVIELADDFDTADHEFTSNGVGTDLQDDTDAVRNFVRNLNRDQENIAREPHTDS